MDRKRDAPIPWSVSLPCVAAIVALVLGWRALGRRHEAPATAPAAAKSPTTSSAPVVEMEPAPSPAIAPAPASAPASAPAPEPAPATSRAPAVDSPPAPVAPREASTAKVNWTPISKFRAEEIEEAARPVAPMVMRLRDRAGLDEERTNFHVEPASRTLVVAAERPGIDRADALVRALASYGERLETLVFAPARISGTARPWVVVLVAEGETLTNALVSGFRGVPSAREDWWTCHEVGRRQLHALLDRGTESAPLEWLVAGTVGAVASRSLEAAVSLHDASVPFPCDESVAPLPSLARLLEWETKFDERDGMEPACFARLATSFVAFCLERGPKDPRAVGLFELLRLDRASLPQEAAARDAEIAARLGATRLDELEAAWRAARR